MHTLTPHVTMYVTGRRARGEISRQTAADYRWTLTGLVESYGDRPLRMFGPAAIDRWLEDIGHLSECTRRQYLSRVRGWCRWMVAQGKLRTDPTSHVPAIRQAQRAPRTLTVQEVGRLLRAVPDPRASAVLQLMVGCGLRCVSVARLQVEDYDPASLVLRVSAKGGAEYDIPVPVEAARALNRYLDEVGSVAGPLVRSVLTPSRGLSPKTLSGYVRAWMRHAGVKVRPLDGRSAHGLRRTAASDVMDLSGDIRAVQSMLGHSRVETTARHYLRPVSMQQMRTAMAGRDYVGAA
jgi:integrase/recombinase XerC